MNLLFSRIKTYRTLYKSLVLLFITIFQVPVKVAVGAEIHVAVASNFKKAMDQLVSEFEQMSQHKVLISYGSTGKHFAQITNGAPYDLFFAADEKRPEMLEQNTPAVKEKRFTYAIGRLALWYPQRTLHGKGSVKNNLQDPHLKYLAIANPKLAPYGKAAEESLKKMKLWVKTKGLLVRGENVAQTYQFVYTRSAQAGFIAYSQIVAQKNKKANDWWLIPRELHSPIKQQVVLLNNKKAGKEFFNFVKTKKAKEIIKSFGYLTVED